MPSPTYEAIAFLQDGSDFNLDAVERQLAEWLPDVAIRRDGNNITANLHAWIVRLHLMDEPFVAEESRDIAEYIAACPRAEEIAGCKR